MQTTAPFSRRRFLKLGTLGVGIAASGIAFAGMEGARVEAAPLTPTPLPTTPQPTLPFVAYHDVTGAEHQNRFNSLGTTGYRILSFSIYGLVRDPRYAAVWVKQSGVQQHVVHGINANDYQRWFDQNTAAGFVPVIVSATGTAEDARFAAVSERARVGPWVARHNITRGEYINQNVAALDAKLIPRSVAIYGNSFDRRYAGVWRENVLGLDWDWSAYVETPQEYQRNFDFLTKKGYRPRYVTADSTQAFAPIYSKDNIGQWVARHNLTSAEYQQVFDTYTRMGLVPVCVQGSGIGSSTRYAAIFVTQPALFQSSLL